MRLLTLLSLLLAAPAVLAQQVIYENAVPAPPAPAERGGDDSVLYAHDDGTGNVNIGPPSTFDPDMLWGNYFLTEEGGEVITQIQVAFGPTFPSLANGPVTFWLLDDPDMDLDPRNATALVSVQGTPDVFGNNFFVVDIPPTVVSGAFFVGASAQLMGGQDAPGRVDTSSPADKSWFFYAPDISEVIDDLASAPFGTRMDDTSNVPFPGAFMVRAIGVAAAQASLDPAEVSVTVAPGETATASVTLSNLAAVGGPDLTFSVAGSAETLIDFEDGQIPPDVVLGNPGNFVASEGGNPGRWLRNNQLATFAPSVMVHQFGGVESDFLGNYVERQVSAIRVDAQMVASSNTVAGRPMSLQLTRYNGDPSDPELHDYVYLPIGSAPQAGEGWASFTFDIPWDYEGVLPEGWGGGGLGDPETMPEGVTFQDIISEVDEVRIMWGHPAFFYLLQDFDLGVDNLAITYAGSGGPVTVTPAEGTVAAGSSQELTLTIDATDLEEGEHVFDVTLATNDPTNAELTLPVTVLVQSTSVEDGSTPTAAALDAAYPNPFAGATTLRFTVPQTEHVTLDVFDATGRRVATLLDASVEAGTHAVTWDASGVASGVYLVRMQAGSVVQSVRTTVLH